MKSEIKENVQETNSDRKETKTQINGLDQKEEINIQPEQNEETRIQNNEERVRDLQDIFKHSNIRIVGVPEGEEEEQKIENLFERIMKKNFPNLSKEIDFQEVQEAQRVPKKLDPRKHTPKHIVIILPKIKDKERILNFILCYFTTIKNNNSCKVFKNINIVKYKRKTQEEVQIKGNLTIMTTEYNT